VMLEAAQFCLKAGSRPPILASGKTSTYPTFAGLRSFAFAGVASWYAIAHAGRKASTASPFETRPVLVILRRVAGSRLRRARSHFRRTMQFLASSICPASGGCRRLSPCGAQGS